MFRTGLFFYKQCKKVELWVNLIDDCKKETYTSQDTKQEISGSCIKTSLLVDELKKQTNYPHSANFKACAHFLTNRFKYNYIKALFFLLFNNSHVDTTLTHLKVVKKIIVRDYVTEYVDLIDWTIRSSASNDFKNEKKYFNTLIIFFIISSLIE